MGSKDVRETVVQEKQLKKKQLEVERGEKREAKRRREEEELKERVKLERPCGLTLWLTRRLSKGRITSSKKSECYRKCKGKMQDRRKLRKLRRSLLRRMCGMHTLSIFSFLFCTGNTKSIRTKEIDVFSQPEMLFKI